MECADKLEFVALATNLHGVTTASPTKAVGTELVNKYQHQQFCVGVCISWPN